MLLLPAVLFAQGTTSGSIEGTITDASGEPLAGANVVAIHQPTGARYGTATRPNGRFTIKSVRVGGPYKVQVTFIGFNPSKKQIENVELGETVEVNFELQEGEMSLDEISVTAQANPVFNSDRTGAQTNISEDEIGQTPTLSRSLSDYTKLTPQATGGGSFGGANDRFNNLMVDGATSNDVFGLGEGTPGSGAGVESPISIDAIKEFNVDIAPFGVTNSNFTGGQINAITKSGTNEFTGSAYYQFRNDNFEGNYKLDDGSTSKDASNFNEKYLGINLGGPIVKDKLFFFVNAEIKRESAPLSAGIQGSGEANIFPFPQSTFDQISDIAQNQYGYDTGGVTPITQDQDNNKILAKINWNISDEHKLSFRYSHVDATDNEGVGRGEYGYDFGNRKYNFNNKQNSFVAELNSNFSNNVSNTFRAVYTKIEDSRDVVSEAFPQVTISAPYNPSQGDYRDINMGIDRFSQANGLNQTLIELTDNVTYIKGNHELTLGTSNRIFKFSNLFVQDDFGTYEFRGGGGNSVYDNFKAGNPYSYKYSYLLRDDNGEIIGNRKAEFNGIQLGFYAQDKYTVSDQLTVTAGIRVDIPYLPDDPTANPKVPGAFDSEYPGNYRTDRVASGNLLWSPRLGFNWSNNSDNLTTQVRGGVGIFSGQPPFVWLSNQYANTGADYGRVDVDDYSINGTGDDLGDGFFSGDPNSQPKPGGNNSLSKINTSEINLISEDFKYPQNLKVNLAIDQELPFGITGTLEGIYSNAVNGVKFKNINLEQVGTTKYGRPLYGSVYDAGYGNASGTPARIDPNFTNAILLENTSKGYNYSITGQLKKQFESGFRFNVSYTYNRARSVNNGSSSRAISNWQYNENKDVNNPRLGTADYERRHRILGRVSYQLSYYGDRSTTFSLIYDGRSGTPFSWNYNGNANGDTQYSNDLVYVPAKKSDIILASNNWDEMNKFINEHASLDDYRGEIVPRGTAREPWTNYLDFRVNQKFGTWGDESIEVTASIFNVLNLLNNEWGKQEYVSNNNTRAWTIKEYDSSSGKPIISYDPEETTDKEIFQTSGVGSRWRLQLGVRYSF